MKFRVVVTGNTYQKNQSDFMNLLHSSDLFEVYVITCDKINGNSLNIDRDKIYHLTPSWPLYVPIAEIQPYDRRLYKRIIKEISPDIVLSLGISQLIFMPSVSDISPSVFLKQGGDMFKAYNEDRFPDDVPYVSRLPYSQKILRYFYRWRMNKFLNHVDEIWTSESNRTLFEDFNVSSKFRPIDWAHVDTDNFKNSPSINSEIGNANTCVIGSFRRLRGDALKPSIDTLFRSISDIKASTDEYSLVVGGLYEDDERGPYWNEYIDTKADEYGISKNITKYPIMDVEKYKKFLADTDVYVNFSRKGKATGVGLGVAAKEAMSSECAIVTFDEPEYHSHSYIVKNGKNGYRCEIGDHERTKNILQKLINNESHRKELGEKARETILANHSNEAVLRSIHQAVSEIVEKY